MRNITDHKVNGLNERLEIVASDSPGPGGANHEYIIAGFRNSEPAERWPNGVRTAFAEIHVQFQNGPIGEADFNGITNEALLAVAIDRMRGFQFQRKEDGGFDESKRGQYACKENACALTHMEEALMWLQKRTLDRMKRGVEGSMKI